MAMQNYTNSSPDNYHNHDISQLPNLPEGLRLDESSTPKNPLAVDKNRVYYRPFKGTWRPVE